MVRGMYTAVSGMLTQQQRLNVITNNLANATTTAYKREESIDKSFPELLIRNMGAYRTKFPTGVFPTIGSIDKNPVVGVLGTGVEQNEIYTVFSQGAPQETTNPADLALSGQGFFVVDTPYGERYTRNGNFIIGNNNILMTKEGYPLLGENGPIRVQRNNFKVNDTGQVIVNADLRDPVENFVDIHNNDWEQSIVLDTIRVVDFEFQRYLKKQGDSLYTANEYSGEATDLVDEIDRPKFLQGYIETSNVEPIRQMVEMIEVNRAYEAGQKVIQSSDQSTDRLLNIRV